MRFEIEISDDKVQNLSQTAQNEVVKVSKSYIEDLLDEASRLEESRRFSEGTAEVTAAIINDAVTINKTYGIRKKKRKKQVIVKLLVFVASTVTGGFFDTSKFNNVAFFSVFLIALLIACVLTAYLIFSEENYD